MSSPTEPRRSRSAPVALTLALAALLFLAVNLIASTGLRSMRLDLTDERLFTLSNTTREILAGLDQPVTLRIYQSSELLRSVPALRIYADRVRETLRAYAQVAGDELRVEIVDPEPFSAEEDRAIGYGLRGMQTDSTGEQGYFGLVGTNSIDGLETIEFLSPAREQFLEYDLTRIVQRLSQFEEPRLAVIDGRGLFGNASERRRPSALIEMINDSYDIVQVPQNATSIPPDTDALLIVHPAVLTEQAQYAVDQYVLNGGPALVFLDPLAETSPPGPRNPREPEFPSSELNRLLRAWGVEMAPGQIVEDANLALQVTATGGPTPQLVRYLPWLQIRRSSVNPDDVVTTQIELMRLSSAGALAATEGAQTDLVPLIATTPDSALVPEAKIRGRTSHVELLREFVPSGEVKILAARISGPASTAFPDGRPPPPEGEEPPTAPTDEPLVASEHIEVIVVADSDMLHDSHVANAQGNPISNNSDFVLNALENLSGGTDLSQLRGRGFSFRPFTRIEAIEDVARSEYQVTEQRLAQELEQTQQRLASLAMPGPGAAGGLAGFTEEQQETIAEANRRILELRQQLRDVRAAFRRQTEQLQRRIQVLNIGLMPALVALAGIGAAVWRRRRLARHVQSFGGT